MKKIPYLLMSFAIILFAPALWAYSSFYMTPEQAFAMAGEDSVVIEAQSSTSKPVKLANGWSATECSLTGIVYKGNKEIAASNEVQTYTFNTVGGRIKGTMPCPTNAKGMYTIYGKSKMGLTTFVGGETGQIPYVEGEGNKLYSAKPLRITNKAMSAKFSSAHPGSAKALGVGSMVTIPSAAGGPGARAQQAVGPSVDDTRVYTKFLIEQYWGNR